MQTKIATAFQCWKRDGGQLGRTASINSHKKVGSPSTQWRHTQCRCLFDLTSNGPAERVGSLRMSHCERARSKSPVGANALFYTHYVVKPPAGDSPAHVHLPAILTVSAHCFNIRSRSSPRLNTNELRVYELPASTRLLLTLLIQPTTTAIQL